MLEEVNTAGLAGAVLHNTHEPPLLSRFDMTAQCGDCLSSILGWPESTWRRQRRAQFWVRVKG